MEKGATEPGLTDEIKVVAVGVKETADAFVYFVNYEFVYGDHVESRQVRSLEPPMESFFKAINKLGPIAEHILGAKIAEPGRLCPMGLTYKHDKNGGRMFSIACVMKLPYKGFTVKLRTPFIHTTGEDIPLIDGTNEILAKLEQEAYLYATGERAQQRLKFDAEEPPEDEEGEDDGE